MVNRALKRVLGATLAVSGASTGLMLASGTSAMAATTGNLVICAEGNYSGYAVVQPINNDKGLQPASPFIAFPGQKCQDVYYGDNFNQKLTIKVYGIYNDSPNGSFYIGTESFNPADQGLTIDLLGTTTSPSLYAH